MSYKVIYNELKGVLFSFIFEEFFLHLIRIINFKYYYLILVKLIKKIFDII